VNVANEAEVDAWFDEALEDLGGLDVLEPCGIKGPTAPIDDVEYATGKSVSQFASTLSSSAQGAPLP
jgi:hypothetical protein